MLKRIATALWGKFESREEVKKFAILALMFGLIIGTYWTMRPIKDSIFMAIVGGKYLWMAKILSLLVITPLVIVYTKLTEIFPRQKFFYVLLSVYAVIILGFWVALSSDSIGLGNTVEDPTRLIGWAWYVFVESFGSLVVALFWAITTDITLPNSARRGFPVIALCGQLGNILGPLSFNAKRLGFATSAPVLIICSLLMVLTAGLMYWFFKVTPQNQLASYKEEGSASESEEEPGFLEGLKLLLTKGYLFGIFAIIALYEVIVTVIDYHFKQTVKATFTSEIEVSGYLYDYAAYVGIVATICLLLGISNIQRHLGMRASLMLLPLLVAGAVLLVFFNPSALGIIFWIMVFSKAVNYALNQPTLKQLYIPTKQETKYKAQAWIEMFGSRGSKTTASFANGAREAIGLSVFLTMFCFGALGLIGCWLFVALYVAKKYNTAIDDNKVVC